jgi:nucleotide-binding universal stress UspA family protein
MYYRSNNIVVYLSPDYEGKLLLQHSLFFQQTLGMRVFICSINEKPSLFKRILNSEKNRSLNHLTPEKLKEFTKSVVPAKALKHFSFRIRSGRRLPLLIRQSKRGGYEFLMVDKSNSESALNPDELDRLISHAFCPVMAVHKNHPITKIKKIVIPVDVTQTTKKKLLWATYFAKKYGAKIIIVSALTLNLDIRKTLVYKNAEKIKSMLSKRSIECEVQILHAHGQKKYEVVLSFIQEEKPDMVIIRTHQESNLNNTRIGNFVSELVHSCKIPVFTVSSFIPAIPDDFVQRL